MESESYIRISIFRSPLQGDKIFYEKKELIWQIDIPRWLYERRYRTINWIYARFEYFNPDFYVSLYYLNHELETRISRNTGLNADPNTLSAKDNGIRQ
ncbi:hypothetical protein [Xanthocytophaga agilis]|uniref:Uncharacterized protein n=1 Tax=Xanthocytophaga agilis TaxID=3048010 RepID=A0AAE3UFW0_9BACT|nr:hypothetical protein [Xanthocytophaga agilis]MDJ1501737.1 hypothetical protein [Xanthocytophaga agilis]